MNQSAYRKFWHPVATADEIKQQPRQCKLLGERIVLFRDATGVIAFRDLCIHRGAALSGGKVADGIIECPYHGWRFDRTGTCVRIPSLPPGASIPAKARAIVYAVRERYGLIWVCLQQPEHKIPEWPEDAWNNPAYRVFLAGVYEWTATPARVIENIMDFSHFNFVHRGLTELADGPVIKPHTVLSSDDGFSYTYEDSRLRREYTLQFPFMAHDKKSVIDPSTGGTWSDSAASQAGDVTIISFIVAPIDAGRTRIYAFLARNHSLTTPDPEFGSGFDEIMEQDRVIVEAQRPEEVPVDLTEELHLRYPDAASIAYRRMLDKLEHDADRGRHTRG